MEAAILAYIGKIAAGATIAVATPMVILKALGFGAAGVAAGSFAAWVQSAIGCVQAGSLFSALQHFGAAGIAAGTKAVLGIGGGIVGALFALF